MIDTDKYEGHSTGWKHKINHSTYSIINDDGQKVASVPCYEECNKDSQLIADAPLLLEDYKRLREKVKTEKNLKLWEKAEVKRLQALIRSKGLCTNCGQSHEGIEVVMNYSEDEVGHRISKECVGTCHPNLSIHCCDLCLCLNGFTIEHDYWEAKKND